MDDGIDKSSYHEDSITVGRRPILIISNNSFNGYVDIVNYFPISTNIRRSPTHIPIKVNGVQSNIQCEQWLSCGQHKIKEYIGTVSTDVMEAVERALLFQADMRDYKKDPNILTQLDSLREYLDNYVNELAEKYNAVGTADSLLDNVLAQLDRATKALAEQKSKLNSTSEHLDKIENVSSPKKKYKRWTEEEKLDIVINYDGCKDDLMSRYNVDAKQLSGLRSRFSKELDNIK